MMYWNRQLVYLFFMVTGAFVLSPVLAQPISAEQNYAANSPGVAMVQTVFSATVYVNKVEMNQSRFRQLVDSVKRLDTTGTMFTAEEKLDIVVKTLYNNPLRFFYRTTEYFRQRHRIFSSGTGFFVTGDGYLVTNAHIIDRDSAFIRRKFILSTYQEVTDANIRSLQASWAMVLSDQQRSMLYDAYSIIYSQVSSMIIFDLNRAIYVRFRIDSPDGEFTTQRLASRVVIKGKAMPGEDIAVLKVDSVRQMPTLAVSGDSLARIGEQVLVYGYPEPVTSNTYLAKETDLEPTLTAGIVSAVKKSILGWPVIQMDAVITHGSSGSPVCNNVGQVIGIATFGSLEQQTGGLASGLNFALPASMVRRFLDSVNVTPALSDASRAYNSGLDLYYQGYYRRALQKFEAARELNEDYPQVYYYMNDCRRHIKSGDDRQASSSQIAFRVLAVLLVIGGIYVVYRWKKSGRRMY